VRKSFRTQIVNSKIQFLLEFWVFDEDEEKVTTENVTSATIQLTTLGRILIPSTLLTDSVEGVFSFNYIPAFLDVEDNQQDIIVDVSVAVNDTSVVGSFTLAVPVDEERISLGKVYA